VAILFAFVVLCQLLSSEDGSMQITDITNYGRKPDFDRYNGVIFVAYGVVIVTLLGLGLAIQRVKHDPNLLHQFQLFWLNRRISLL
jgi:hypothetical protein